MIPSFFLQTVCQETQLFGGTARFDGRTLTEVSAKTLDLLGVEVGKIEGEFVARTRTLEFRAFLFHEVHESLILFGATKFGEFERRIDCRSISYACFACAQG